MGFKKKSKRGSEEKVAIIISKDQVDQALIDIKKFGSNEKFLIHYKAINKKGGVCMIENPEMYIAELKFTKYWTKECEFRLDLFSMPIRFWKLILKETDKIFAKELRGKQWEAKKWKETNPEIESLKKPECLQDETKEKEIDKNCVVCGNKIDGYIKKEYCSGICMEKLSTAGY